MNVMRQQPNKERGPTEEATSDDIDQGVGYSSFAHTIGYACYCCGGSGCRLHHCSQKGTLPREKWLDPVYFDKYQKSKEKKVEAEEVKADTIIGESHVQVACIEDEIVSDDDCHMVFSG